MSKKKQPPFLALLALALVPALSGCAVLWIGGGAAAGYALTRDSMAFSVEDRSFSRVWEAALRETQSLGAVKAEDPGKGRLDARVQGADVVVTLEQLTVTTVRVKVRARKNLLPKRDVAEQLGLAILRDVS